MWTGSERRITPATSSPVHRCLLIPKAAGEPCPELSVPEGLEGRGGRQPLTQAGAALPLESTFSCSRAIKPGAYKVENEKKSPVIRGFVKGSRQGPWASQSTALSWNPSSLTEQLGGGGSVLAPVRSN